MMHHARIAQRAFNTPLMVEPSKALAFLSGLGPRIAGQEITFQGGYLAEADVTLSALPARASLIGGGNAARQQDSGERPFTLIDNIAVIEITGTLVHRGAWIGQSSGLRLMNTAHYQAARTQLDNPGSGGPWADPFDDPTGTILWSRWINGSTSGTAKENCALWSSKLGFSGTSSACEWRTNSGSGRANVELLNWETLAAGPLIVRMRCKVETYVASKVWLLFNTVFADPLWEMYVDVTPDGTAAVDRVGLHSPEWSDVWVEEHPSHPGWMFIKARLDLTGAADVDGSFTVHMTDANQSDELFPLDDFTMIRIQDLTIEQV